MALICIISWSLSEINYPAGKENFLLMHYAGKNDRAASIARFQNGGETTVNATIATPDNNTARPVGAGT
jgi:hypothetical protein